MHFHFPSCLNQIVTSCPRSIVYTILNIRLNLNAHKIDKTNKMAIESGPATWSCSHTIQYPQSILISTSWRSLRHTNFMVEFIKTGLLGFKLTLELLFCVCFRFDDNLKNVSSSDNNNFQFVGGMSCGSLICLHCSSNKAPSCWCLGPETLSQCTQYLMPPMCRYCPGLWPCNYIVRCHLVPPPSLTCFVIEPI